MTLLGLKVSVDTLFRVVIYECRILRAKVWSEVLKGGEKVEMFEVLPDVL